MTEWIDVNDRMPERAGGYVLVLHGKAQNVFQAVWLGKNWHSPVTDTFLHAVTHWRPLPTPPGTDAAPGEAELGRELIAWAADEDNVEITDEYGSYCVFPGCNAYKRRDDGTYEDHAADCPHLRAHALRGDDE